jgi:hypothetical protein
MNFRKFHRQHQCTLQLVWGHGVYTLLRPYAKACSGLIYGCRFFVCLLRPLLFHSLFRNANSVYIWDGSICTFICIFSSIRFYFCQNFLFPILFYCDAVTRFLNIIYKGCVQSGTAAFQTTLNGRGDERVTQFTQSICGPSHSKLTCAATRQLVTLRLSDVHEVC